MIFRCTAGEVDPNHPCLVAKSSFRWSSSGPNPLQNDLVAASKGWNIAGAKVQVLVSSHDTGGRYTICSVDTAGNLSSPLHTHSYEDISFYILEGDYRFRIDGEVVNAGSGSWLFVPSQTPYAFSLNDPGGRFLVVAHPGGLDLFFQDVDAVSQGKMPAMEELAPVLEKHGIVACESPRSDDGL
jgi:quercetin dioxygenase-like cupin family protein